MNAPVVFVGRKPSRPIVVASGAIPYVSPVTSREMVLAMPSARGMSYAPAGAAQTTSYPAGTFNFRSSLRAFRTQPNVNAQAFIARFNEALAGIMPGVRGSASVVSVTTGGTYNPSGGLFSEITDSRTDAGPTWNVVIVGNLTSPSAWMLTGAAGLNRVIARALYNATTMEGTTTPGAAGLISRTEGFATRFPAYRPVDGSQIQAVLDNPEACGSFVDFRQMWMSGCTTVTPTTIVGSNLPTAPVPTATTTSQVGASTLTQPRAGGSSPASSSGGTLTAGNCAVNIVSQAWIRPTATFDRVGPIAPPGSLLVLLGKAVRPDGSAFTQGSLSLYHVQVAGSANTSIIGTDGFAALDPTDIGTQSPAGCSAQIVRVPVGANAPVATVPRPASAPPLGTPLVNPPANNTSSFPWGTAALAAGVVLVGGAAIINRDKISRAVSSGKSKASSSYARAKQAYRDRRGR